MTALSVFFKEKVQPQAQVQCGDNFKYKYVYRTLRRTQLKRYRTIAGVQKITQWPEMIPHLITITTAATVPLGTKLVPPNKNTINRSCAQNNSGYIDQYDHMQNKQVWQSVFQNI